MLPEAYGQGLAFFEARIRKKLADFERIQMIKKIRVRGKRVMATV